MGNLDQIPGLVSEKPPDVPQWRHNVSDKKSYTEVHIKRLLRGYMQNLGP